MKRELKLQFSHLTDFDKKDIKGLARLATVKIKKGLFGGGLISD